MVNLKRIVYNIHLILGLVSGIIVFIVAITGSTYVFKSEIENVTQSYRDLKKPEKSFLPPSRLRSVASDIFPDRTLHGVVYGKPGEAAEVYYYEADPLFYYGIIVNPYNGEVLKVKNYQKDFFYFMYTGHTRLWMPPAIGEPIVRWGVVIFVVMLLTGIVLWWPARNAVNKGFRINWKAPWSRRLLDLHSVFGFYALLVLLVIALTGLVWGFQWFSETVYSITGGNKEVSFVVPESDTTSREIMDTDRAVDSVWRKMLGEYTRAEKIEVHFPHSDEEALYAHVNPDSKTYWKTEFRYFDQNTLEEIKPGTIWGTMEDASLPGKIRRLNYDIHTGAIGGLPGKILVFFASLIAASLPVTGFLMWWKKRKEKQKLKSGLDL